MDRVTFGPGFTAYIDHGNERQHLMPTEPAGPTGPGVVCPAPGCLEIYKDRNSYNTGHLKKAHPGLKIMKAATAKSMGIDLASWNPPAVYYEGKDEVIKKWHQRNSDVCPGQTCEPCHGPQAAPPPDLPARLQALLGSGMTEVAALRLLLREREITADAERPTPGTWDAGGQLQVRSVHHHYLQKFVV